MHDAIEEILNTIDQGYIFDSHYIIEQLIKKNSDAYLNFASAINTQTKKTLAVHGQIGKEIAKFEGRTIQRLGNRACSENIHDNSSKCTAWQKI